MKAITLLAVLLTSSAWAYRDGTYHCANKNGLPDNTFKIETVKMGSAAVPYVEITRYFKSAEVVQEANVKGFATHFTGSYIANEVLTIGSLQLEFQDDKLIGCKGN